MRESASLLLPICVFILSLVASCTREETIVSPPDYSKIDKIVYSNHVQPLLNRECAYSGCHDVATKGAGLSLTSWNDLIKGSSFGEVLVPHRTAKSLLTTLFDGTALRKPHPSTRTSTFTTDEVQFVKRWINEGAKNDQGVEPYQNSRKRLYVPNQAEDNVAIVDIDSLVVCKYVDVGSSPALDGPHFIEANDDYWYVSLIGTAQVWKFDAHMDTLVKVGAVAGQPALMALTPDGTKLYVSQFMSSNINKVTVFNTATMQVTSTITVGTMPHGIRMSHDGSKLYCVNMLSDDLTVIAVATDQVIATVPLAYDAKPFGPAKYMPIEVAVSPDDSLVLVTCSETQEVRMFDATSNTLVDSFHVGDQPWHLQFTPDGQYCYVSNRRGNSVSVIHLPMRHVMETITTSSPVYLNYPHGCDISRDGRYTFVSNENVGHAFVPRYNTEYVGNVCVIDNLTNQIVKVLEVGKMPTGISVAR